ncbi:MAG: macro domain-containing protein [Nostocales cyanobacterium 94392]|nr:macro domain-containing protein [Nostocales cyanobacterium 94392]
MKIKIIKGNIFTSQCQTLVNTVNCVGVMGAGIALEFRLRYPEMYKRYVELCKRDLMQVGKLWLYKSQDRWVLNFPTKTHWKYKSKVDYLRLGLQKFVDTYRDKKITSIAFPLLGAQNGGIAEEVSLEIMKESLYLCDIPIEIYIYDPLAPDDLYKDLKAKFRSITIEELVEVTGLGKAQIQKIQDAMNNIDIHSIACLTAVKGIGQASLDKLFRLIRV